MKSSLKKELSAVKHVATTTDCWAARQRNFLGVTCHWINEDSLQRRFAALSYRPPRGSHTSPGCCFERHSLKVKSMTRFSRQQLTLVQIPLKFLGCLGSTQYSQNLSQILMMTMRSTTYLRLNQTIWSSKMQLEY